MVLPYRGHTEVSLACGNHEGCLKDFQLKGRRHGLLDGEGQVLVGLGVLLARGALLP